MGKCKYGKIGEKYGRLTIIGEAEPYIYSNGGKARRVLCQCDCGSDPVEILLKDLRGGKTISCGCYKKECGVIAKKYNTYDLTGEYGKGYTFKGEEFYFDLADYDLIKKYCWHTDKDGYLVSRDVSTRKFVKLHRLIMNCMNDSTIIIDHINRDKNDNRKDNLRMCTRAENSRNKSLSKNNKSGVTGVFFNKKINKWGSQIIIDGKSIYLGTYKDKNEAIKSRIEAEIKYFGEFSPNYKNQYNE